MNNNEILLDIILPTKNRWHLIEPFFCAMKQQLDKNFNLVIADNSDNEEQFLMADTLIKKYSEFYNIKYYKTGGLGLIENWEKAYTLATSKYIYLTTDKILLHKDTVKNFNNGFKIFPNENIFTFANEHPKIHKKWEKQNSNNLINLALSNMKDFLNKISGAELKICISKSLRDEILKNNSKLIDYIAGDIDVVFISLMSCSTYCILNYKSNEKRNLNISSIGGSGEYFGNNYMKFLKECNTTVEELSIDAPIQISNNFNGLYNNLFRIAKKTNYSLDIEKFDRIYYWISLYKHLIYLSNYYHTVNKNDFIKMYNYLEANNLQYNSEIRACMNFYSKNIKETYEYSNKNYEKIIKNKVIYKYKKNDKIFISLFWGLIKYNYKRGL